MPTVNSLSLLQKQTWQTDQANRQTVPIYEYTYFNLQAQYEYTYFSLQAQYEYTYFSLEAQ